MKTLIILGTVLLLAGCTDSKPKTNTKVIILIDQTSPMQLYPDAKAIVKELNLENDVWKAAEALIGTFSNLRATPMYTITLDAEESWKSSKLQRQSKVNLFTSTLTEMLQKFRPNEDAMLKQSVVFLAIQRSLVELSKSTATHKILYLYSDLFQNTEDLSVYNPKTLIQMKEEPDKIIYQLEDLPGLSGIVVYSMYNPESREADERYAIVSAFVKTWLERKHATFICKASH